MGDRRSRQSGSDRAGPARRAVAGVLLAAFALAPSSAAAVGFDDLDPAKLGPFGDEPLEKGRRLLIAGKKRAGARALERRVAQIEVKVARAFGRGAVTGPGSIREVLDRWFQGEGPALVVGGDRFHLAPDLYRLLAWARLEVGDLSGAAVAACELLDSGRAEAGDVEAARALAGRAGAPPWLGGCVEEAAGGVDRRAPRGPATPDGVSP